ncbi:hypothetical protein AYO43_09320 [Nitrospira sp. SCGC AG-212-E16]|nr:hypothetical protein AYO43_09320 [Nitrospira sp. SCGC AG-212-E16]
MIVRLEDLTRYFLCILLFGIFHSPSASTAELREFETMKGKGLEICDVCLQNLRQQSVEQAICERQYNHALGLEAVQWTELDLRANLELYKRITTLISFGDEIAQNSNFDPKEIEATLELAQKVSHLRRTRINIDNSGPAEELLQWTDGNCKNMFKGFPTRYASALLVLGEDHLRIDRSKSNLLVRHLFKSKSRPMGIPNYQLYGVFQYKGRSYFDKWDGGGGTKAHRSEEDTLSVYRIINTRTDTLCRFRLRSHNPQ